MDFHFQLLRSYESDLELEIIIGIAMNGAEIPSRFQSAQTLATSGVFVCLFFGGGAWVQYVSNAAYGPKQTIQMPIYGLKGQNTSQIHFASPRFQ